MSELEEIFAAMQKIATENMQPVPFRYFLDDGIAYAECENRNPIVMATLSEKGTWEQAW